MGMVATDTTGRGSADVMREHMVVVERLDVRMFQPVRRFTGVMSGCDRIDKRGVVASHFERL